VGGSEPEPYGQWVPALAVALVVLSSGWSVSRSLRRGQLSIDVIALIAMVGALVLGEYLTAAVIAVMLAGGNALEAAATRRAERELTALVERAPRTAHRRRGDRIEEVEVDAVAVGDVVLVRSGEVVPVDGVLVTGEALVDESSLTGEALPVAYPRGARVRSGAANAATPFELEAESTAAESAYAGLVRLVERAQEERAPFVRLADRYATIFLPVTLVVAGAAWLLSGDPERALAVVVVATPCPLILAAPIALMSGISRAARRGILVKGGGAIEQLGTARTVLLDKTGTVTTGTPTVERVVALDGILGDEVLRLAASLDQLSAHVLAEALVGDAHARGLRLSTPSGVIEDPGSGIEGRVDGRLVAVGSAGWLRERGIPNAAGRPLDGGAPILVGVDGSLAGVVVMTDRIRPDAANAVDRLRAAGIAHLAMVSGDRTEAAERAGREIGVDQVYANRSPEAKLAVVRAMRADARRRPVAMVGDGVNDAPALALADVGIAMGAGGSTVSAETADAVITVDRVDRVADAVEIGRRSLRIARQSVLAGMGLSLLAMGFAAAGLIAPLGGAILQEAIDVVVIVNALRALGGRGP
jgi:heavy metal translocating P-type ATPase